MRLRLLLTVEDGIVLDVAQVWVPVPGQPATLVVSGSTPTLDLGDELARTVDAVAASIRCSAWPG